MSDGAHLNMPAEGAMRAVLGAEEPKRLTDEEFEQRIRTASTPTGYDETATYAARLVLEFLEQHPEHSDTPIENEGESRVGDRRATWDEIAAGEAKYVVTREGLYDVMKAAGVPLADLDLTGFMWGWAANAARKVLGLEPAPNPAIVEVST